MNQGHGSVLQRPYSCPTTLMAIGQDLNWGALLLDFQAYILGCDSRLAAVELFLDEQLTTSWGLHNLGPEAMGSGLK